MNRSVITVKVARVNVDAQLKQAFIETCKENGLNASEVLRQFMRSYVHKNGKVTL